MNLKSLSGRCCACLRSFSCLLALSCLSPVWAQTAEAVPVPAPWQSLGISVWPAPSPHLVLWFDEIVLPGLVKMRLGSEVQFTQKLVLFAYPPGAPEAMTELASFPVTAKTPAKLDFNYPAAKTRNIVLLAQTPGGWLRVERQLKIGRKP
jgi:hypothetical protein